MGGFILRRILVLLPILLGISLLAFLVVRAMPGDAAMAYLKSANIPPSEQAVQAAMQELGLDRPLPVQYFTWLGKAVQLDFGKSYINQKLVTEEIFFALQKTLLLAFTALFWIFLCSVPLGIYSALAPNGKVDHFSRILSFFGASMPSFWMGFLLVQLFALKLRILPVAGATHWQHLILPSVTLAFAYLATYSRILRNSLLENLGKRFVYYGRARGLTEKMVVKNHVLRNSLLPIVTSLGINFASMLSGSVIVENVFSWPGLGRLIIGSIASRDYPMIQGYIVLMGLVFILSNLLADVLCAILDPRIRMDG